MKSADSNRTPDHFTSPLSEPAILWIKQVAKDTVHGRVKSPLATPFSELRSEGADNARLRPLGVAAVPSSMPYERGRNRPAASDLAAVPLLDNGDGVDGRDMRAQETTTARQEYAKASIGIVAGVLLTLAVETWALFDMGFIRLKDPQAAEKAVAAAYWDEVYTKIAVNPQED